MHTSPASAVLSLDSARCGPQSIVTSEPESSGLTIFAAGGDTPPAPATLDGGTGIFIEFRRKLASGEAFSRALVKLAEALRFTGRITISFHQGHVTKTVMEESYFSEG
jgi:hypothetical protein